MVEQTFLGKFMGGYFMLGQMIRSCRGWKVNTTIRGSNLKNTCTLFLKVWGFHVKPVFFFLKKYWSPVLWCLGALLDSHIYGPNSWRSELRHYIQNRKSPRLLVTLGSNEYQAQCLTLDYWSCPLIVVQS